MIGDLLLFPVETTTAELVCPYGDLVELNDETLGPVFNLDTSPVNPSNLLDDSPINVPNKFEITITLSLDNPIFRLMKLCLTVKGVSKIIVTLVKADSSIVVQPVRVFVIYFLPYILHYLLYYGHII